MNSTETKVSPPPGLAPNGSTRHAPASKKRRGWAWLLFILVVALSGYFYVTRGRVKATTTTSARSSAGGHAITVVVATATRGNMGVYLTGLGTVTAFNTVTVRTRVDGELTKVAFEEGQLVHQGDLLAEIDPRPYEVMLEQAEGQMARDVANLNNAKVDLSRYQVLAKQDAIPTQQLDTQAAMVRQAEGGIKSDQGAIDAAKLQLVYCHIKSPLTGRIGLRLVDQGNIVHAADQNGLAVLTQLQPIALIFNIGEDHLPEVTAKMRAGVKFAVEAWDRASQRKIATGTLLTIDNQVDVTTATVRFKAAFPNEDDALFPNQFVNARLLVDTKRNVVIVPAAAIQRSPDATFVYVVKPDSTVETRNVVSSLTESDQSAIDKGLEPGEMVVTDGVDKLQPGMKVRATESGAPPGGPKHPSVHPASAKTKG